MWPAWPRLRFPVRRASWPTSLQALSSLEWLGIVASGEWRVASGEWLGIVASGEWRVAREEKFQSAPGDEAGRNAQGEDHTPLITHHSSLITHHSPLATRHYSEPLTTPLASAAGSCVARRVPARGNPYAGGRQ